MAYGSYYPGSYQNSYYPLMSNPLPAQNQQTQNSGIIWVVGEGGADSYLVAPGQTVQLWDSTSPVFYLKTADAMGRPSKRVFDYTERGMVAETQKIQPLSEYASKEDVDYLKNEIEALRAKFGEMEGKKK